MKIDRETLLTKPFGLLDWSKEVEKTYLSSPTTRKQTVHINSDNLQVPTQTAYEFVDGELHSDPLALLNYFAAQESQDRTRTNCYTRSYEKAKRLQRMAERARKDRQRHWED